MLQEQIDYLTKKLFGSSSEAKAVEVPGQLNLFDEAETEQALSLLEDEDETLVKEHIRKKKATHAEMFKGLKVNHILIPLKEDERSVQSVVRRWNRSARSMYAAN